MPKDIHNSLMEAYQDLFDLSNAYSTQALKLRTLTLFIPAHALRDQSTKLIEMRNAVKEQEGIVDELLLQLENA